MSSGTEGLKDFEEFAKAEKKRAENFANAQSNKAKSYWYADSELKFKRDSMWDFFSQINSGSNVSSGEITANKRAADTVAACDRAYKFRRQARLDNVPRQTCLSDMDKYYWDNMYTALKAMTETTKAGG